MVRVVLIAMCFFILNVPLYAEEEAAQRSVARLDDSIRDIEARIKRISSAQDAIKAKQGELRQELNNLEIWIRRH
jgi:hypothetical protein